ncbi:MAG: electron transport complex subunit E [Gammaproteobacteria bacterium]
MSTDTATVGLSTVPARTARLSDVFKDGVWRNNAGLVQLLGLCPMLAVTTTLAYGIGLGVATTFVLVLSNFLVSLTRTVTAPFLRIPVYVLLIASLVTLIDILLHAYLFELHRVLGLFVPLIVTNCAIIARAESFASRQPIVASLTDGLAHGLGFTFVLMALGFIRELIGAGTLFASMDALFGPVASNWTVTLHDGFLLMLLPPGAFFALGALLALRNVWTARTPRQAPMSAPSTHSAN